jgi:hypothetical protein
MKRHRLQKRYGHTREGTAICVLTRPQRINDAPGGHATTFEPGDRVEVGELAANTDYLVAHRVQRLGEGWKRLGPFAVVARHAIAFSKGRR